MFKSIIFFCAMFIAAPSFAEGDFPYNVLQQDTNVVVDLRAEGENVWVKLGSKYTSDTITVRISDKNRDYYRPWSNGELNLISVGFRGNNVWSDRVQTSASYIEYWHNDTLVLHLEKQQP